MTHEAPSVKALGVLFLAAEHQSIFMRARAALGGSRQEGMLNVAKAIRYERRNSSLDEGGHIPGSSDQLSEACGHDC